MIKEIVNSILKEAVDESDNIIQILLTILSSYTSNPLNLRILAPSGEGKTWQVKKTAQYFPQDNIWEIQQASATALRYFAREEVIEVDGEFIPLEDHAREYFDILANEEASKKERDIAQAEISKLRKESYKLLDFTNKTLIFLDSQNTHLWDTLKQTLSHDSKIRKDWTTNKINGSNSLQKVVYKGYPAVIYCSAKDEINTDETGEINNRFNTISIKGSFAKYKKMQRIVLHEQGAFYEKYVISNAEKEETKKITKQLIDSLDHYQGVFNPYEEFILEHFPATTGNQSRDLRVLSQNMNLLALANAENRISLVKDDQNLVMVSVRDLADANNFTKKPLPIPLTKIQYFNSKIKAAIEDAADFVGADGAKAASQRQIAEELEKDSKQLYINYLVPLEEHGYLETIPDPTHTQRLLYAVTPPYRNAAAPMSKQFLPVLTGSTGFESRLHSCLKDSINLQLSEGYRLVSKTGEITLDALTEQEKLEV